jgi:DNA-binding IclR family transcriptional regulator
MGNIVAKSATRQTVAKAMRLLHAFSPDEPELGVGEISRRLGMHKSVVSRLAATLCEWRMLEQDPSTRRLRLGLAVFQLGMRFANHDPLRRIAGPYLNGLVRLTRQSAHVSIRDGHCILVVATVESPEALRVIMRLGDRRMLYATAAGKVLLAHLPDSVLDELVAETGLAALTPATLATREALQAAVLRARREGLAWNNGESSRGAGAVAAPILGADGAVAAALSVVFPLAVVSKPERLAIAAEVKRTAAQIAAALGAARQREAALPAGRL